MTDGEAVLDSDWTLALRIGNDHEVFARFTAFRNTYTATDEQKILRGGKQEEDGYSTWSILEERKCAHKHLHTVQLIKNS